MRGESNSQSDRYQDIIDLPHPTSVRHPRMPKADRAAQFAPFSALTGYDAAVDEAARLTEGMIGLDEDEKEILDLKQRMLAQVIDSQPEISVTHFIADSQKAGGRFQIDTGRLCTIDDHEKYMLFSDGKKILLENIVSIEADLFKKMFL